MLLAPTVNLQRSPFGGRNFEFLGEDPLLTAAMGRALVRGIQRRRRGRHGQALRRQRLRDGAVHRRRPGRRAGLARALPGALRVHRPAGPAVGGDGRLQRRQRPHDDRIADAQRHPQRRMGVRRRGRLGLACRPDHSRRQRRPGPGDAGTIRAMGTALAEAVRQGLVSEAAIDDKVLRLLRLAARVGALRHGARDSALNRQGIEDDRQTARQGRRAHQAAEPWTGERAREVLRATAAAGFVLARNEHSLLPLDPRSLRRVAVLGPNAAVPRTLGGGSATVFPPYRVSPLDGLRAALEPGVTVDYSPGVRSHTRIPLARARPAAPPRQQRARRPGGIRGRGRHGAGHRAPPRRVLHLAQPPGGRRVRAAWPWSGSPPRSGH